MKKLIITSMTLLMTLGFTIAGVAQKAPQQVKDALGEKYPEASYVEWDYNNDKDEVKGYEAEFVVDMQEYNAFFTEQGDWIKTEIEASPQDVPESIVSTVKNDYAKYMVDGAYEVHTPDGLQYKVELDIENDKNDIEYLLFDQDGTLVKEVKDNDGWLF